MAAPLTSSAAKLDTPPWLQEPTAGPKVGGHQPSSLQSAEEGKAPEAEPQADVPRMILYTRVINLILSICMIVVSLLAMLTTQSATTGVLACYLIVFACLLCCFETHLKQVSKIIALNFGFMYSARARSVFMLFVGKFPSRATIGNWNAHARNNILLNFFYRNDIVLLQPVWQDYRHLYGAERLLQRVHSVQVSWIRGISAERRAERHQRFSGGEPGLCEEDGQRRCGHYQEQSWYVLL